MRKIISVLLVTLMLFSVMAVSVSAAGCGCPDHREERDCRCCINCTSLPKEYIMSCAKDADGNVTGAKCCTACAGYLQRNAGCGCSCEKCCGKSGNGETSSDGSLNLGGLVTEKDKQNFVDSFQAVLRKISDVFDNIFDRIFEFLRLDEILGRN